MKYVVLKESRVVDILRIEPTLLYPGYKYMSLSDDVNVGVGMVYDSESGIFAEYIEPVQEPTQLDRVEANIDYLVLLNS